MLANETKIKAQGLVEFSKKKIVRLLIPYIVFELIGVLVQAVFILVFSVDFCEVAGNILTVHCYISTNWFLVALFFAEILQYLITKYVQKKWHIFSILLSFVLAFYLPETSWILINCRRICAALSFIMIGIRGKEFFEHNSGTLFVFSAISLFVGAAINTGTPSIGLRLFENPLLFILCGISGAYVTLFISKQLSTVPTFSKPLVQCGKASLVIMGTHYIVPLVFIIMYGT